MSTFALVINIGLRISGNKINWPKWQTAEYHLTIFIFVMVKLNIKRIISCRAYGIHYLRLEISFEYSFSAIKI